MTLLQRATRESPEKLFIQNLSLFPGMTAFEVFILKMPQALSGNSVTCSHSWRNFEKISFTDTSSNAGKLY